MCLGFLFGVPRSVITSAGDGGAGSAPASSASGTASVGTIVASVSGNPTAPNTNLEQISDWLTKVLVGATLTQLNRFPPLLASVLSRLGELSAPSVPSSAVFVGGLSIYSVITGFMFGWIATRGWLPWVLEIIRLRIVGWSSTSGTSDAPSGGSQPGNVHVATS